MAYIYFDSKYAPCGFLIVKDNESPYDDKMTVLIQSDWDFPGVASRLGFVPCVCCPTDGTVDCKHKTASEMIGAAYDYLRDLDGQSYESLDDYFLQD